MPTPVKTRFVSTVLMMTMMLKYREAVVHCYSNQEKMDLRKQNPQDDVWEITKVIVEMLEPLMIGVAHG